MWTTEQRHFSSRKEDIDHKAIFGSDASHPSASTDSQRID